MDFIKWKDEYSVKVAEVDSQHKKLISLVNQLGDAMSVGKGRDIQGRALSDLVNYTVHHFQTEERFFRQYDYPEYENHKRIHDELTAKAKVLKSAFGQGSDFINPKVIMHFLGDWLNMHIIEEDRKYGPYLNSKGIH
jgi:hemerythrin